MKGTRWTTEDEAVLTVMFKLELSLYDTCIQLDRSCAAVIARLTQMKLLKRETMQQGFRVPAVYHAQHMGRWKPYIVTYEIVAIDGLLRQRKLDEDQLRASRLSSGPDDPVDRHLVIGG